MISIRPIHLHELPALLQLYTHLHPADDPLPERSVVEAVWNTMMADPKITCFVADSAGQLVGSCILTLIPNLTRGARPYGLIENVVTHGAYRRLGIGTRLLQEALACAWNANCYKVMLLTGSAQEAVLRFYEQAGFAHGVKTGFIALPPDR